MRTTEQTVRNPSGLHARPAAMFVKTAAGFASKITVENLDRGSAPADAKSIIAVMSSGVAKGHRIRVTADGADEDAAIETLEAFVASGMGETIPEE
jgi:phosphocarrier protein FPr